MDEISLRDDVLVGNPDWRTQIRGKVVGLNPDATGGEYSRVLVKLCNGELKYVPPRNIQLVVGERSSSR